MQRTTHGRAAALAAALNAAAGSGHSVTAHAPATLPHVPAHWPSGHRTLVPLWVPARHARYSARQARTYVVPAMGAMPPRPGARHA